VKVAFVVYPDFTALDLVGPYEVISRWPGAAVHFIASSPEPVRTDRGLTVIPTDTPESLRDPNLIVVPGSGNPLPVIEDEVLLDWVRAAAPNCDWTASVCTGAGLYAAAGLVEGKTTTTHWAFRDNVRAFGVDVVEDRVVWQGNHVSAAGVSAGIDMALALTGRVQGRELAKALQLVIEYDPQPPFDSGSPRQGRRGDATTREANPAGGSRGTGGDTDGPPDRGRTVRSRAPSAVRQACRRRLTHAGLSRAHGLRLEVGQGSVLDRRWHPVPRHERLTVARSSGPHRLVQSGQSTALKTFPGPEARYAMWDGNAKFPECTFMWQWGPPWNAVSLRFSDGWPDAADVRPSTSTVVRPMTDLRIAPSLWRCVLGAEPGARRVASRCTAQTPAWFNFARRSVPEGSPAAPSVGLGPDGGSCAD